MNYDEYSDNELCSMICESDEEAKEILFNKYSYIIDIVIKKYLLSSLKVGIEYNDLYQEALVGFTDALNSYDETKETSIKTFITLCVERKLQNTIVKANSTKNKMLLDAISLDYNVKDEESPLKEVISDNQKNDPLLNITNDENYKELLNKIKSTLSDKEYEVFLLMTSGLSYIEISEQLNKNPKQIDNTIQRIKIKLKKVLEK
jgi:RNA polymerase sporulation-specific sigma factor